ncbi:MAG: cysteine desulfurase family protein [Saprospiraceae bacterium]|nr:cysteine desulfurase family protein [Saprospiraceae bacterium]
MNRIYFDNASTTPLEPRVYDLMIKVMKEQYGNPSSIHFHGRHARSLIEDARKKIANILRASIGEIYFCSTATEANNMVLKNAVEFLDVQRIITSPTEHHCVLHTLDYLKENKNIETVFLEVDSKGNPNLDELETLLKDTSSKTIVSLMHGNNEIGTQLDFERTCNLCSAHNALFHCDAVQSMGKYDIDLSKHTVSFLSGASHKFHGPKGVGFFYMNGENIIPPFIHGGAQERNMRAGTENLHGIVGMAEALTIAYNEREDVIAHISKLRKHFKHRLMQEIQDIQFNGNQENHFLHHVISVSFPSTPKAEMLMFNLDIAGISASSGSACSSGIETDSHVLVAIGHEKSRKTVRFSFSKFNTIEEVDAVVEKIKTMTPTKANTLDA